jgi:uncharacterized protein YggE
MPDTPTAPYFRAHNALAKRSRTTAFEPVAWLLAGILTALAASFAHAEEDRIVQVSGTAEERVAPDMALLRVAAVADDPEAQAARRDADQAVARALEVLTGLGIDARDIDTSGLQIAPQYRWLDETRERQLTGYRVTRSIDIRLLDLALLGDVLTGLSDAGINQVAAPELGLTDPESVYQRALAAAAINARARAAVIAEALDAQLGPVVQVSTRDAPPPRPLRRQATMLAADSAAMEAETYQSGDLSFSVNLFVTFELR